MSVAVDVAIVVIILLCGLSGFKKGVIRSAVQLLGTALIVFLAYKLKTPLANYIMGFMPFLQYKGVFLGISAINILMYQLYAFILIFVIAYCILNIIINATGIIDKLLTFSLVFAIPDKILGLFLGLLDGVLFAFLLTFVAYHISPTEEYIHDSTMGVVLLEHTPFVSNYMSSTIVSLKEISKLAHSVNENTIIDSINGQAVQDLILHKIITKEQVQKLRDDNKLIIKNVMFS